MDWTRRMQEITSKVTALNKNVTSHDFAVGACIINDYECSKMLMELNENDWQRLLRALYESKQMELASKVEMLLCYVAELKRLAGINLKELIGLTRDDVAAMQRTCVLNQNATRPIRKMAVVEVLTSLLGVAADSEESDRYLAEVNKKGFKRNAKTQNKRDLESN